MQIKKTTKDCSLILYYQPYFTRHIRYFAAKPPTSEIAVTINYCFGNRLLTFKQNNQKKNGVELLSDFLIQIFKSKERVSACGRCCFACVFQNRCLFPGHPKPVYYHRNRALCIERSQIMNATVRSWSRTPEPHNVSACAAEGGTRHGILGM